MVISNINIQFQTLISSFNTNKDLASSFLVAKIQKNFNLW